MPPPDANTAAPHRGKRSVRDDIGRLALEDIQCAALYRGMRNQVQLVCDCFETPDLPALARLLPRLRDFRGIGPMSWSRMRSLLERVVQRKLALPHVCVAIDEALSVLREEEERERETREREAHAKKERDRQEFEEYARRRQTRERNARERETQSAAEYEAWQIWQGARKRRERERDKAAAEARAARRRRQEKTAARMARELASQIERTSKQDEQAAWLAQFGAPLATRLSERRLADAPLAVLMGPIPPEKIARIQTALGPQTLGSMAHVMPHVLSGKLDLDRVGEKTVRALAEALLQVAADGMAEPTNAAQLVGAVRDVVETQRYSVLRELNDGPLTMPALAKVRGLSRARVHQLVQRSKKRLKLRFGALAFGLLGPVWDQLLEAGGVLHESDLRQWAPHAPIRWWPLPMEITGHGYAAIAWDEFLVVSERRYGRIKVPPLKLALRKEASRRVATVAVAREVFEREAGWKLRNTGARRYIEHVLGFEIAADGEVLMPPRRHSIPEQAVDVLRSAGRPLAIEAIARRLEKRGFPRSVTRNREGLHLSLSIFSSFARLRLVRAGEHYVHRATLGVSESWEKRVGPACIEILAAAGEKRRAADVLSALVERGDVPPEFTEDMLVAVLEATPPVLRLNRRFYVLRQNRRVVWSPARKVIDLLVHRAPVPVSLDAIREELVARGLTLKPAALSVLLRVGVEALHVGHNEYLSATWLGLTERDARALVGRADKHLPRNGSPIAAATLLEHLRPSLPPSTVKALEPRLLARALAALVGRERGYRSQAGALVARDRPRLPKSLWQRAVLRLLASGRRMSLGEMNDALRAEGFEVEPRKLSARLSRMKANRVLSQRRSRYSLAAKSGSPKRSRPRG